MTNAEKYLKDEVNILELWENFSDYYYKNKDKESDVAKAFKFFFCEQATPTLTEDERVILRNIDTKFYKIGRTDDNIIYFIFEEITGKEAKYYANVFDNIFQFIKNGEEYSIEELLK